MTNREIDDILLDKNCDIWIDANAGSGKTTTLIRRFISLVVNGEVGNSILCITFTRVAANELMVRIKSVVNNLLKLEDSAMLNQLKQYSKQDIDSVDQMRSRLLTVQQSRLNIMTIDSFAFELMQEFSNYKNDINIVESDHWQVNEAKKYAFKHTSALLIRKISDNNKRIDPKYRSFINNFRGDRLSEFLHSLAKNITLAVKCDSNNLLLAIAKQKTSKDYHYLISNLEDYRLLDVIKILDYCDNKTSKLLQKKLQELLQLTAQEWSSNSVAVMNKLINIFLIESSNNYAIRKKFLSTFLAKQYPELNVLLFDLANLVHEIVVNQIIDELFLDVSVFDSVAVDYYFYYTHYKKRHNIYEFIDILHLVVDHLRNPENISSLGKLYKRINHFMLDEAQDTGVDAWQLIDIVIENILEKKNNDTKSQSIFIVGDPKQAIYSFQGADFNTFGRKKIQIANSLKQYGYSLHEISLINSYRSAENVLKCVDSLFNSSEMIGFANDAKINHICTKVDKGFVGIVELQEKISDSLDNTDWVDKYLLEPRKDKHCEYILEELKNLILSLKDNGYTEKDIMILSYNRKASAQFLARIPQYLNQHQIRSNNIDRIAINDSLVYQDIIALLKFIWLPNDNLNLFCLLLSPIFNFDRRNLERHIHLLKDGDKDLYQWLADNFPIVYSKLAECRRIYFEYEEKLIIYHILDLLDYYTIYPQLGVATIDNINTCANIINNMVSQNLSLPNIITMLEEANYTITNPRDSSKIYVGTVHSVKGAESEIVILLDLQQRASSINNKFLFNDDYNNLFFVPRIAKYYHNIEAIKQLHQREMRAIELERMRLLYVAITRAKREFYMIGYPTSLHFPVVKKVIEKNVNNNETL